MHKAVLVTLIFLVATGVCVAQQNDPGAPSNLDTLITLITGAQSGQDDASSHMMGFQPAQILPMVIGHLGLDETQIRQIGAIFLDFARTHAEQRARRDIAGLDLIEQLLIQDEVDEAVVEQRMTEINQAEGEMRLAGTRALLSAREVLTPEQRSMLQSMILRMFVSPHTPMHMRPEMSDRPEH